VKAEVREIAWDHPPEDLFAGLCDRAGAFFLDSALTAGGLGRYSFIGFDPFLVFRASDGVIRQQRAGGEEDSRGDVFLALGRLLEKYRCVARPDIPLPGGAVGYFSYEFGARLERVACSHVDDFDVPDVELGFYDGLIAFDHAARRAFMVANPVDQADAGTIFQRLEHTMGLSRGKRSPAADIACVQALEPRVSFPKNDYLRAIARIKDYIAAGDVYQVNLTQRFDTPLACHPYELYQRLRQRSPAPFASYLNCESLQVVSSSPERFLQIKNGRVTTRPIKGTRPRGKTPAEDFRLRQELVGSPKDRAELLMIVDLERNDLGRVCEPGTIQVDELFKVETHPTVHHLVANVAGRLRPGGDVIDCLRAMLPGGSITGAPKIRAMQIIDELEKSRRGIYTGAVGYIGFDGNCDLNIAIRTILCAHGRAFYHVGGGIVWDSDPESEYQETLDKGTAMRAALMEPNL
jgi:para-aminobenzoate synthetase component 1